MVHSRRTSMVRMVRCRIGPSLSRHPIQQTIPAPKGRSLTPFIMAEKLIKFLPSYVGSKAYWVKHLQRFSGRPFVEFFAGSAVLSANLASQATLIDIDPYVTKILADFDHLIVPETFTPEDYFRCRALPDWWKYAYCLQRMSFSGVFRYSKNGFNVPIKTKTPIHVREEYERSLQRWVELNPVVIHGSYIKASPTLLPNSVLVFDPPYQTSQASYNDKGFNYKEYWEFVHRHIDEGYTTVIFDLVENLPKAPVMTRKMRVNGARQGNVEGMCIYES